MYSNVKAIVIDLAMTLKEEKRKTAKKITGNDRILF